MASSFNVAACNYNDQGSIAEKKWICNFRLGGCFDAACDRWLEEMWRKIQEGTMGRTRKEFEDEAVFETMLLYVRSLKDLFDVDSENW